MKNILNPRSLPFVSIVLTYYERLGQLFKTLDSFKSHGYSNFEIIIVDDGSKTDPISEELLNQYSFEIYVINMPLDKTYTNPSVAYNRGFLKAKGDIIIIQNSECLHLNNVVDHARANVREDNYITYACFSLSKDETIELISKPELDLARLEKKVTKSSTEDGKMIWKNHSKHRPKALHFTSVITKGNLDKLGGFDKRYANGTSYDDEEILERIKRIPLNVQIEDKIITVHQWHGDTAAGVNNSTSKFALHSLHLKNQLLFKYVTKFEKGYKNNINSIYYILFKFYSPIIIFLTSIIKAAFAKIKEFFGLFNA